MTKESLAKKSISYLVDLLKQMNPDEETFRPLIDVIVVEQERNSDIARSINMWEEQKFGHFTDQEYEGIDLFYRISLATGFDGKEVGWELFTTILFLDDKKFERFRTVDDVYSDFGYDDKRDFAEKLSLKKEQITEILAYANERKRILGKVRYLYFLLSLIELYKIE